MAFPRLSLAILAAVTSNPALANAAPQAPVTPPPVVMPPTTVAPPGLVASARIIMLRIYVSDIARSEHFYHEVLGANVMQRMGDKVRIMIFQSGGMPGIILIQSPEVATMHGSFVVQVPDLQTVLDRAKANGGTLKNTDFSQQMAGTPAHSSHFSDPDGNLIEVLQIGGGASAKP